VSAFVAAVPAAFAVIAGSAPTFYASLCVGATGGILAVACVVPELCVRLYEAMREDRHDEALALQRALTPLAGLVTSGHGVAGLKAAMDAAGFVGGAPRRPLLPLAGTAVARIRAEVAALRAPAALAGEERVG
jgi:4-hydroxy-2-oxoglutarate aldolase